MSYAPLRVVTALVAVTFSFLASAAPQDTEAPPAGSRKDEPESTEAGKAASPSDRKATVETRALCRRLHQQAGRGILFGQQDATAYGVGWSDEAGRCDVKEVCGAYPSVYGWELGDIHRERNLDRVSFASMKTWIREADARGGINTISMHLDNPVTGRNAWDNSPAVKRILPGGDTHASYLKTLDRIAAFLEDLRRVDGTPIPIVFRPYHEHNQKWPWWGKRSCSEDEFIALWRMTVEHLRDARGIHHLLYAISPQDIADAKDYMRGYPGDDYVDVFGLDFYRLRKRRDVAEMGKRLSLVRKLAERHRKVSALTETGIDKVPLDDWWTSYLLPALNHDERSRKTAWALVWRNKSRGHHFGPYPGHPSAEDFVKFYDHPLTVFGGKK
jgi:mannan endo-1,4-beta-mannosidase